jgi:subtilisin-like proprotein convertase family protein
MKLLIRISLVLLPLFLLNHAIAQNNFWKDASEAAMRRTGQKRMIIPNTFRTLSLDTSGLLSFLRSAPKEFSNSSRISPAIISIPMPDGLFQSFTISESAMMEPGLAAMFPNIKTFGGQGLDDRTATIKIDWTPLGFHAMVFSSVFGTFAIDPYAQKTLTSYISYYKKDLTPRQFSDVEDETAQRPKLPASAQRTTAACTDGSLRSYRLAVACTGEYGVAVGATSKAQTLAAVVTSINRVNGVYEKELSIRLVLVAENIKIMFFTPATDPFTQNDNGPGLLGESQTVITDSIGSANFDIGHTFSTGAGGVASLGVVCTNSVKARGVTGLDVPVGDAYDIDFVAHEIGHQFGGHHTFNSITGNCGGGTRTAATAVEPGSGSTIMAYAGICQVTNDLQDHSEPYFHSISFNEIDAFVHAGGGSCAVLINTGNNAPIANAGANYTIPLSTPFMLTGSATDADGDALTYSWEQIDLGPAGNWNSPSGNAPLFRSFAPASSPVRLFPKASNLVGNTITIGEVLPSYARTMNFRLTARDNRAGGGGQCSDDVSITVANSGPFLVTAPNTGVTWDAGDFKTITWNVANTNVAPVGCANVSIQLSTDGGLTFPITIIASTPNDGSEEIIVPNNISATARIRIKALDNIFYDISNVNFTIRNAVAPDFVFNSPAPAVQCSGINPAAEIKTSGLAGYSTPITLSATGNPAGSTVVFSPNPAPTTSNIMVTLQGNIAPGTYNITVTGTSGSIVKNRIIQFLVGAPSVAPVNISPANNAVGVSLTPAFSWQAVPSAAAYSLLISASNTFADTVQSITGINSTNYTLTMPLVEDVKYFWRVASSNSCGTGAASAGFQFVTASLVCGDTVYSTNVPVTIPVTASTVASIINIPAGGLIADVDVIGLKGTHSYVSDLVFTLTSPAATSATLINRVCGSTDNFDINLDDEAPAGAITCPPIGGQVRRPVQALSAFDNQNRTGNWTLSISDAFSQDGGSLTGWGLKICTYAPVYTFIGNGNWTDAVNWKNGNIPPLTLPAGSQILINPSAGSCTLNVAQAIAAGGKLTVVPAKTFVVNVSLTFQ